MRLAVLLLLLAATARAQTDEPTAPAEPPAAEPQPPPASARPKPREPSEGELRKQLERLERAAAKAPPGPSDPHAGLPLTMEGADGRLLSEQEMLTLGARSFFAQLLAGDARTLVSYSGFPFFLEDRRLNGPEELLQEWLKHLRSKRTDLVKLYSVEVLLPAEMEKKYGRPPARLLAFPWRSGRTYLAVANLSGRAAVAVLKQVGDGDWRVVGYHD